MDVVLYVYDLSKGLAKDLSLPIVGVQIDAIYHTSLVFDGTEYFFGRGIQQAIPGSTHHGKPMETVRMGTSELPMEVVIEYMDSLAQSYTEESYDLFLRNCNNFTHDLAMFLVGRGIPDHIKNLPETFLNTPFGQMLKPYLDTMLRGATQGPPVQTKPDRGQQQSVENTTRTAPITQPTSAPKGYVHNVTTLQQIETLLSSARNTCAVIFFTSATCPPCKIVYPAYDQLAEEAGKKAVLIKVDISKAYDVSSKYNVRATPTFITFLKGEKENEWSGANEAQLRGNVRLLVQMACPSHPHSKLKVPSFERKIDSYVCDKKVPPLDKLVQKLGPVGKDDPCINELVAFIKTSNSSTHAKPALPDLPLFSKRIPAYLSSLPPDTHFALIDLVRIAFVEPRVSGYFAEEKGHKALMSLLSGANDLSDCPFNHQYVMTLLACNMFASHLYQDQVISHSPLREVCIRLAISGLQSSHKKLVLAGSALAFNLTAVNHNKRLQHQSEPDSLPESDQFELVASLLETIRQESDDKDVLRNSLLALGLLVHRAPIDGDVVELCRAMEASVIVTGKLKIEAFKQESLIKEMGQELLGKGLERP